MSSKMAENSKPAEQKKKKGSVLVIGGGIAGIQASLDLADSGQHVELVEKSPAIGGNMARLDKTFPTNDCSMCILSPKVVECGRHLNVNLHTLTEVTKLSGRPGRFTATIRKKARYVDADKCTGCGACLENCPTRSQPVFNRRRKEVEIAESERKLVEELIAKHGTSQASLMRILQDINEQEKYLPQSVIYYLSQRFSIPVSTLYRIGTFYTAFSFTPRGKHTVSVCTGTACHIKGAPKLIDELKKELQIDVGGTTEDRLFSLETVRCLGCCSIAPVVKIGRVYGYVKPSEIPTIINDYRRGTVPESAVADAV